MKKHVKHGVLHGLLPAIYVAAGWYGGAKFDAPDRLIQTVDIVFIAVHATASPLFSRSTEYVSGTADDFLRNLADQVALSRNKNDDVVSIVAPAAIDAGDGSNRIIVANASPQKKFVTSPESQTLASHAAMASHDIQLCVMDVSNAPSADSRGVVASGDAKIVVKGASLLVMPATNACLSSGYGLRGGKAHSGIDYYTKSGGMALAAGDGIIIEMETRSDYGNMLVIDHGDGVFSRYAHLRRFTSGISEGLAVAQGQVLGPIGETGATNVSHLHFEVLTGDYDVQKKSFGLTARDPLSL